MKQRLKFLALSLSIPLLFGMALPATAFDNNDCLVHMGADLQDRKIPLAKGFGDNLLKQKYFQTGAYAGMRFFEDSLGFECGYQRSISRSQNTDVTGTSSYFGSTLPAGTYVAATKSAMQNLYGSLVGLIPLSQKYPLKLILSLGAGRTRMRIAADANTTAGVTAGTAWPLRFKAIKWVPKAGLGFQYMLGQHVGLRTMAGWEQTSQFKKIRAGNADGSSTPAYFASFKNGASVGLGFFYSF